MRKVTYGAACSLDGFIAGPGGAMDWLHWSDDVTRLMAETWSKTDAVLIGRKTWEVSAESGGGGEGAMAGVEGYVFSRTLTELPAGTGATLVRTERQSEAAFQLDRWREVFGSRLAVEVQLHHAGGHEAAKELWECYLEGPESGSDPAGWRTELNRPLTG